MNIFVLNENPVLAARDHCDKHVVKMIIEYAQMLSSAHRYHDGELQSVELPDGKNKKLRLLPGETVNVLPRMEIGHRHTKNGAGIVYKRRSPYSVQVQNQRCYLEAHVNHPCTVWTRETSSNYSWLFKLFEASLNEYAQRYSRRHAAERIYEFLSAPPANIRSDRRTPFALAMPDEYKGPDAVEAYRRFYIGTKARFAKWRFTEQPEWYRIGVENGSTN